MREPKGLPARASVLLSCGHRRKVMRTKQYPTYYCLDCDDRFPIKQILKPGSFDNNRRRLLVVMD